MLVNPMRGFRLVNAFTYLSLLFKLEPSIPKDLIIEGEIRNKLICLRLLH